MKKTAIKKIDSILFVVLNFIFLNINPERIIKIAKDHRYVHNSLKFKVWKDKKILVPIPPIPKSPKITVLLIAHSKRYKPKFLNVSIIGFHTIVNKEENLGAFIWFIDSKLL